MINLMFLVSFVLVIFIGLGGCHPKVTRSTYINSCQSLCQNIYKENLNNISEITNERVCCNCTHTRDIDE